MHPDRLLFILEHQKVLLKRLQIAAGADEVDLGQNLRNAAFYFSLFIFHGFAYNWKYH